MDEIDYDEIFPETRNLNEYWEPDFSSVKAGDRIVVYTETENPDEWMSINSDYMSYLDEER